jgi:hypothetical protein
MIQVGEKTYVTPQEASSTLKIPKPTVYQWCRNQRVELLEPSAARRLFNRGISESSYLIESRSLIERHRKVHLGEE